MTRIKLWKYTPQNEIMLPYTHPSPKKIKIKPCKICGFIGT